MANLRAEKLHLPYGDQAIFVPAKLFKKLGGYREIPLLEDVDLVRRLRSFGRIAVIPIPVVTSSRRWEKVGGLEDHLDQPNDPDRIFLGYPSPDPGPLVLSDHLDSHIRCFRELVCNNGCENFYKIFQIFLAGSLTGPKRASAYLAKFFSLRRIYSFYWQFISKARSFRLEYGPALNKIKIRPGFEVRSTFGTCNPFAETPRPYQISGAHPKGEASKF